MVCNTAWAFSAALWTIAATPTFAAECQAPCLSFGLTAKLKSEGVFSANPSFDTGRDTGPSVELELGLALTDQLSFGGVIIGESVIDRAPGENRAFGDLGVYVGELQIAYTSDHLRLRFGKFDPQFGLGSAMLEGQYTTALSDAYDTDERLGVEAVYVLPGTRLSQSLTASVFTTDRSIMSRSLGVDRGQASLDDGGAGNVRGLGSVVAFYDICSGAETESCFTDGDIGGRIGVRYQKPGQPTEAQIEDEILPQAEFAYLGAVTKRVAISKDTDLRLLGELAYLRNFEGSEEDAIIGTVSAALDAGPVSYTATYSKQKNRSADGPDFAEEVVALGARYKFGPATSGLERNWMLDVGYRHATRSDGTHDNQFGLTLSVAIGGSKALR